MWGLPKQCLDGKYVQQLWQGTAEHAHVQGHTHTHMHDVHVVSNQPEGCGRTCSW